MALYFPCAPGRAAFDELHRVNWNELEHAYGRGKTGNDLSGDVAATLTLLGSDRPDRFNDATEALFGNLCHQGTIYQATAYAIPFVAAFAAGDMSDQQSEWIRAILACVGYAASRQAPTGSHAGSWGSGVDVLAREAFRGSQKHLSLAAERHARLRDVVEALISLVRSDVPDLTAMQRLDSLINDLG